MSGENFNTKMAEGADDPEGEESSEGGLPPTQLYPVSGFLCMPQLRISRRFCPEHSFVCMLSDLFFQKGEGKENVRHGSDRRAGKKSPDWKLCTHSHRHGPRGGLAPL